MSSSETKSANDPVRDQIVGIAEGSLNETIYAGAGAGTGKTKAMVERIANLVTQGGVKPENIAAITFTNAAASLNFDQRTRSVYRFCFSSRVNSRSKGSFGRISPNAQPTRLAINTMKTICVSGRMNETRA